MQISIYKVRWLLMCCGVRSLPPLENYFPDRKEIVSNLYGLFASVLSSSILFSVARGILSAGGYLVSYVLFKAIDYFGEVFGQEKKCTEERIQLLTTVIKVAGTIASVLGSIFILGTSIETLLVSFGLYLILSNLLKFTDPLSCPS